MRIKILDDFIQENGTPEQIEAYQEYCRKLDGAPIRGSFIITNAKIAEALNEVLTNNSVPLTQSGSEYLSYKQKVVGSNPTGNTNEELV